MQAIPSGRRDGDDWRARAGALLAANQHLLPFPLAAAAVDAALAPLVPRSLGVWGPAQSVVQDEIEGASVHTVLAHVGSVGAGPLLTLVAVTLVGALVAAYAAAAFLRSIAVRRTVIAPPRRLVVRLALLYVGQAVVALGLRGALGDPVVLQGLVLPFLLAPPTLYADYAVAFEDVGVVRGLARSVRVFRQLAVRSLGVILLLLVIGQVVARLIDDAVAGSTGLFVPFLVVLPLSDGLLRYLSDCVLIAVFADGAPLGASGGGADASGAGTRDGSRPTR